MIEETKKKMLMNFRRNCNSLFLDECGACWSQGKVRDQTESALFYGAFCTAPFMERDLLRPNVEASLGFYSSVATTTTYEDTLPNHITVFNIFLFLEVRVVREMDHRRVGM
ncbi:hypothetical protein Csa_001359 [Cucumis sativus]|uniref:Uncharacterized protein n=1 Tax=Cucumis sativus TaxID=3659 RepID=A0A0A0LER5_CUCSA|nr:hypothetical protein Csa_001359 [Cucumis sativus]